MARREVPNFGSSVAEALACGTPVVVGPSNGTAQYTDSSSQVFADYTCESIAKAVSDVIRAIRRDPLEVRPGGPRRR
jgi:glycosyltransferase involved in cell wall biosynthesis